MRGWGVGRVGGAVQVGMVLCCCVGGRRLCSREWLGVACNRGARVRANGADQKPFSVLAMMTVHGQFPASYFLFSFLGLFLFILPDLENGIEPGDYSLLLLANY